MKDWTKASLKDDGIKEDSEFFEYIGRMRELDGDFSEFLRNFNDNSYIRNKLEEISQLLQLIQEIRYYHFDTLVKTNSDIKLNVPTINNTNYTDAISLIDEVAYTKINQLYTYILAKDIFNINNIIDSLKKPLLNLANMNFAVYERACQKLGVNISEDCKKDLDDFNLKLKELEQPLLSAYTSNTYNNAFSHSIGIPNPTRQNTTNYQTPSQRSSNPSIYNDVFPYQQIRPNNQPRYNDTPQHPQSQSNNQHVHTNSVPHKPVRMHQTGKNRTSVRKRKRKTLTPVELLSLSLATTACIVGISVFASNILNHITTPSPTPQPTQTPHTIITTAQPTAQPNIIVNIPTYTPANTKVPVVTPTPTSTPNIIKKGTLSYTVQFMDDELISVVANSLKASIDNYNEWQINMYGNGCNRTFDSDKEYVTYVFSNLDTRASCMNWGGPGNTDRFAIAPQMEQLSGDIAKYLIANAIGDSGKYNKSDYSIEDIDFYYSIYGGKTKSFDVRTVKIKNNTLFEDQLIGRADHFNGSLKNLINAHCTLNAALEGGKKDKLTKMRTKCAFGTQEGTVINDASLDAYHALVNLLQGEYELKINSQGKGIKIEYDKDLEH